MYEESGWHCTRGTVCIPCPVEQTMKCIFFFGSGSTVLITDILSLQVHYEDNAFEMQALTSVRHNFMAKYK